LTATLQALANAPGDKFVTVTAQDLSLAARILSHRLDEHDFNGHNASSMITTVENS